MTRNSKAPSNLVLEIYQLSMLLHYIITVIQYYVIFSIERHSKMGQITSADKVKSKFTFGEQQS